jgi:protein required for attachment to host cells
MGAQRERHRIELERRFSVEIARKAAALARNWATGSVVLVADPRMLGFLRGAVRGALKPAIRVKELAKDYAGLTASRLRDRLAEDGIVPARRGGAP